MTEQVVIKRIVVGIDGSRDSLAALRWSMEKALEHGAVVDVVHCWQPDTIVEAVMGTRSELQIGSECMLDNEIAAATKGILVKPEIRIHSLGGKPSVELVKLAVGADLLVLGAHRNTTMHDVVFGQVNVACLRGAGCEVAIIDRNQHMVRHQDARLVVQN